jgi:hypothetical protein
MLEKAEETLLKDYWMKGMEQATTIREAAVNLVSCKNMGTEDTNENRSR